MDTYKIKRIFKNSVVVTFRKPNGDLQEMELFIDPSWDKDRIQKEISLRKIYQEREELDLKLDQYFSVGEEFEFVDYDPERNYREEQERQEEENRRIIEEENQKLLDTIIEYRNTPADYKAFRWYEYPTFEEQFDALYWMRQGVMEPIQELDKKIKEVKEKYPKDTPTLTNVELDAAFPHLRSTNYIEELKAKNIQADFLE